MQSTRSATTAVLSLLVCSSNAFPFGTKPKSDDIKTLDTTAVDELRHLDTPSLEANPTL